MRVLSAARESLGGRARPAEPRSPWRAARGPNRPGPVDFLSVSVLSGLPGRSGSSEIAHRRSRVLSAARRHVLSAATGSAGRARRPEASFLTACTFTGIALQVEWSQQFESTPEHGAACGGNRDRLPGLSNSKNASGMYFQPHEVGRFGGTAVWDQPRRRVRTAAPAAYLQRQERVGTAAGNREFRQQNQELGRQHVFMSHETCCMSRHGSGDDGEL